MKKSEFMAELMGYYGDFQNDTVAKLFVQMLNKIDESDLDRLFEWFLVNIPANWKVDVTTLTKGVNSCCIFFKEPKKRCPICNALNGEKARFCSNCGYDYSVPAVEYRSTLAKPEDVKLVIGRIEKALGEKKRQIRELQNEK